MDTHTSLSIIERRIDALERMLSGDDDDEGAVIQNVQANEVCVFVCLFVCLCVRVCISKHCIYLAIYRSGIIISIE
jgi:hypothetical protein